MLKIVTGLLLIVVTLGILGCGGSSGGSIQAAWITPQTTDTTASIPVSDVENFKMTHFRVDTSSGDRAFMAYEFEGNIYVRANVCPPCGSVGFSLSDDILVCDTCATTFDARTGEGISGGCVNYPKQSVPYEVTNGRIVMAISDLEAAYLETLFPGLAGMKSDQTNTYVGLGPDQAAEARPLGISIQLTKMIRV